MTLSDGASWGCNGGCFARAVSVYFVVFVWARWLHWLGTGGCIFGDVSVFRRRPPKPRKQPPANPGQLKKSRRLECPQTVLVVLSYLLGAAVNLGASPSKWDAMMLRHPSHPRLGLYRGISGAVRSGGVCWWGRACLQHGPCSWTAQSLRLWSSHKLLAFI